MALKVYKASAGTGKTYRLTLTYLALLLGNPAHFDPYAFYNILAVTFTNKATDQMKTRILDTLAQLSRGQAPQIAEELCLETGLSYQELVARAGVVHKTLLHHYSWFSVSTLDAFFQRVLQAFVLEAGLARGYAVDTDTDYLLDKTARRIVASIPQDASLRLWFTELIQEKLSRSDRWDTLRLLKQTGQQATRESFRVMGEDFARRLSDRTFLKEYIQTYRNIIESFENNMALLGRTALQIIRERGFEVTDFPYKTTSFARYFEKISEQNPGVSVFIPGKRVLDAAAGDEQVWHNKNAPEGLDKLQEVLGPVLDEILTCYNNSYREYATAVAIKEQIPQMGLLADIITTMRQIQEESGTLDIGDSTYLLSRLVSDGNVPFVYEKIGTRYDSFLLDEFQDTSVLQWINMYPLVLNGLSQGHDSLIVGDVKQAIYRWRNSDWRILGETVQGDPLLAEQGIEVKSLQTNYRSSPRIVQFVNRLIEEVCGSFTRALKKRLEENSFLEQKDKEYMERLLPHAYEGHWGETPEEQECDKGYVQVSAFYEADQTSADQKVLQGVRELLVSLVARGYAPSDILILVRSKADARILSRYFMQQTQDAGSGSTHCPQLLTEDALYLVASPYVNTTIALLTLAYFPQDSCAEETVAVLAEDWNQKDITKDKDFLNRIRLLPLVDAFEAIIQKMEWSDATEAIPYLQELHDVMLDYSGKHSGGTYAFLKWWHERGKEKMLSVALPGEAVRMLTIHKAKGLEAPVVIVPFCNWPLDPSAGTQLIWTHTEQEPFNRPERLPVQYSARLEHTYFAKDYYLELSQRYLDALNLLYVAVTRPKEELYLFLPFAGKPSLGVVSGHIWEALFQADVPAGKQDNPVWSTGIQPEAKTARASRQGAEEIYTLQAYSSGNFSKTLKLAQEIDFDYDPGDSMRQWGIVLHKALSRIQTSDGIASVLEELVAEGELSGNPAYVKHIAHVIEETLRRPDVSGWFDGSWHVRTEPIILGPSGQLRPDRVMEKEGRAVVLDYKFGRPDPMHQKQIDQYVAALKRMGYTQVEGHLLYITL